MYKKLINNKIRKEKKCPQMILGEFKSNKKCVLTSNKIFKVHWYELNTVKDAEYYGRWLKTWRQTDCLFEINITRKLD